MHRLSMHAEAVDAGVFGVAPIAQHPELHQLVHAYGITLGERRKKKPELLRAQRPQMPHCLLGVRCSKGKALTSK